MADEESTGSMETPISKKRRVLKRIKKKKPDLNLSSTKKKRPFSYGRSNISLSSSMHKQSLRANNKALAFNLERARETIRLTNEANLELQRNNQELHMKITTLERVAGIKNQDIENEVKLRMKQQMSDLKTKMVYMTQKFYEAFACMDDVMDTCNVLSRYSVDSNGVNASIGGDTTVQNTSAVEGHRRSLFSSIPKTGFPPADTPMDGFPYRNNTRTGNKHDMSIIAETSIMLEDTTPPSGLMNLSDNDVINDIEETENELEEHKQLPKSKKNSKSDVKMQAPQRVLKRKSGDKPSEESQSKLSNNDNKSIPHVGSPAPFSKKTDRRGTFVVNIDSREKTLPSPESKTPNKVGGSVEAVRGVETLGIPEDKSLSTEISQKYSKSPVLHIESEQIKSKHLRSEQVKSASSKESLLKKVDSPKVTTSERTRSKSRDKNSRIVRKSDESKEMQESQHDRRKTFVLNAVNQTKEPSSLNNGLSSESTVRNNEEVPSDDRRKTFLVPQPPTKPVNNLCLSPSMMEEDVTKCFSIDMEMTEVIDSTQMIQLEVSDQNLNKNGVDTASKPSETASSNKSTEAPSKSLKQKTESVSLLPVSSDSSDTESLTGSKPAVEFRVPRPGKIVFSACRKEVDGSRKPVPSKLPQRSRSKSKIKLNSRSKSRKDIVCESPKLPKSIFDFHDKTPKQTVESAPKISGSVYDLSMNESVQDLSNKPSLSQFRECQDQQADNSQKKESIKSNNILPSNPVYYVPLKECSPEGPPKAESSRARSKSRSRKSDRDNGENQTRARSKSRPRDASKTEVQKGTEPEFQNQQRATDKSQSRARSRSRHRHDSKENKETCSTEIESEAGGHKLRARSSGRQNMYVENSESGSETEHRISISRKRSRSRCRNEKDEMFFPAEVESSKTRSRSVHRKNQEDASEEVEVGKSISRARSRSRQLEDEETVERRRSRGRSKTRKGARNLTENDHKSPIQKDVKKDKNSDENTSGKSRESTSLSKRKSKASVARIESSDDKESIDSSETEAEKPELIPSNSRVDSEENICKQKSRSKKRLSLKGDKYTDSENEGNDDLRSTDKESSRVGRARSRSSRLSLKKKGQENNEPSDTSNIKDKIISQDENLEVKEKQTSDEIPRLAEELFFVTRRDRSLKPAKRSRQGTDANKDDDLLFDFGGELPLQSEQHDDVEKNKTSPKLTKETKIPAETKTPKEVTQSGKLKKLKRTKSTKRRRSSTGAVRVSDELSLETPHTGKVGNSSKYEKENDRNSSGLDQQMQGIRRKLMSLKNQQSEESLGSRPSSGLLQNFDFNKMDMGSNEPEVKRQRRGTTQVCYKEVPLSKKLRREDVEGEKNPFKLTSAPSTPVRKK